MNFQGYIRPDGQAGTRNLVLVIPSVGCAQGAAEKITAGLERAVFLPNNLGCGQVAEDRILVKRTLTGFGQHPNVCSVLIVGLGCEQLTPEELTSAIAPSGKPVAHLSIQHCGGTTKAISEGRRIVEGMLAASENTQRVGIPISQLILGTECGGSDYTSGLAANPALGQASDRIISDGGTVILSETPELIGAEHIAAGRARTPEIAEKLLRAVSWWEERAEAAGQNIRESNPSPGNIRGGITTLEEKSLGCIHKAGTSRLEEVISYASRPSRKGLVYMDTPAHDIEQLTGMVAGGAQVVVFTTGMGTPVGSPIVPVIKITGNRNTCRTMAENLDLDVSGVMQGRETIAAAGERLLKKIVTVASGEETAAEILGQRDFCIFQIHPNI